LFLMRVVRRVSAAGALTSVLLLYAAPATAETPQVTSVIGEADGLFIQLFDESFGPEPSVTLPSDGGSVSDEVVDVSASIGGLGVDAGVLGVEAEGDVGPNGFATAESTVAELTLSFVPEIGTEEAAALAEVIPDEVAVERFVGPFFSAEAVKATCEADLAGTSGSTTLVGVSLLGEDVVDLEPDPNTSVIDIDEDGGSLNVTLNRQVENPDGSLSVSALFIEAAIEGEVILALEIGPATCGVLEDAAPEPAVPVVVEPDFTG
jgi:hypothetical protein